MFQGGLRCNVWNKSQTRLPHSRDRSDAGNIGFPFPCQGIWLGPSRLGVPRACDLCLSTIPNAAGRAAAMVVFRERDVSIGPGDGGGCWLGHSFLLCVTQSKGIVSFHGIWHVRAVRET